MSDEDMIFYHASRKGIKGNIQPVSRSRCDFSRWFYMRTEAIAPLTLICNEDKPRFYQVKINLEGLKSHQALSSTLPLMLKRISPTAWQETLP